MYGNDVTCLTAHNSRSVAEKVIEKFADNYAAGKLLDPDSVAKYIRTMPTDKMPGDLPQFTLRTIEKDIESLFFGLGS